MDSRYWRRRGKVSEWSLSNSLPEGLAVRDVGEAVAVVGMGRMESEPLLNLSTRSLNEGCRGLAEGRTADAPAAGPPMVGESDTERGIGCLVRAESRVFARFVGPETSSSRLGGYAMLLLLTPVIFPRPALRGAGARPVCR